MLCSDILLVEENKENFVAFMQCRNMVVELTIELESKRDVENNQGKNINAMRDENVSNKTAKILNTIFLRGKRIVDFL